MFNSSLYPTDFRDKICFLLGAEKKPPEREGPMTCFMGGKGRGGKDLVASVFSDPKVPLFGVSELHHTRLTGWVLNSLEENPAWPP